MDHPNYPVSPTAGDFSVGMAKERVNNCKAKSLLYGGDGRPETPVKEGKKSVAQASRGAGAPFATYDAATTGQGGGNQQGHASHPKPQGASKVGAGDFDPAVYRNNIASNASNMAASKAKNYGSGIVMPAREQAAPGGYGGQQQQAAGGYGGGQPQQQADSNRAKLIGGKFRKPDQY